MPPTLCTPRMREKESDEHHLHHLLAEFWGLFLGPVLGLQPWDGSVRSCPGDAGDAGDAGDVAGSCSTRRAD